jgi:hypothetical protein
VEPRVAQFGRETFGTVDQDVAVPVINEALRDSGSRSDNAVR